MTYIWKCSFLVYVTFTYVVVVWNAAKTCQRSQKNSLVTDCWPILKSQINKKYDWCENNFKIKDKDNFPIFSKKILQNCCRIFVLLVWYGSASMKS